MYLLIIAMHHKVYVRCLENQFFDILMAPVICLTFIPKIQEWD